MHPPELKESDWKKYKPLRLKAIERYCLAVFKDTKKICDGSDKTAHDRYRNLYTLIEERDKKIGQLFDPQTRSRAVAQLAILHKEGFITDDETKVFSPELHTWLTWFASQ